MSKTEEENERALAIVESLMKKGEENLTPEEDALLDLFSDLIHDFEEKAYPIESSEPHEMLAFLLEQRVSEILAGKREATKQQAKRLAEFFHVGVELFI